MLRHLSVQNVALIDRAELDFSEGLNVLSGETGAGKSVLLDAIDFVLGAKADKSMVRTGAGECTVRAEFYTESKEVGDALEDLGLEREETLVISRTLTAEGRSSLKLNGCTVTAAMLRRVTSLLVDIHGQSEHFFLLKEANQLKLLDTIAGEPVMKEKEALSVLLSERRKIVSSLAAFGTDEGERSRRLDVLSYQIEEIARADLKEGEEEKLLALRERFRNAEKILSGLAGAEDYLTADGGALDAVNGAKRSLAAIARYDARYAEIADRLENAAAELDDIAASVEGERESLDLDEREAERVEERLDEIKTVKKKYGGSVEAALAFAEQAKREYAMLSESGETIERLRHQLAETDRAVYRRCEALASARKKAADGFSARVVAELAELAIPSARFEVQMDEFTEEDAPKATAEGLGGVRFLFSANAGEPLKELSRVISGGEASRFMLAVKAQLSKYAGIDTYIFDEIDAGIGGRTAQVVAEKFCRLSGQVQILAVSHLARIAAFADREFLIEKREEGGRAQTFIREVTGEERVNELARLIGGKESEHVVLHARELLGEAERFKNAR